MAEFAGAVAVVVAPVAAAPVAEAVGAAAIEEVNLVHCTANRRRLTCVGLLVIFRAEQIERISRCCTNVSR